GYTVYRPNYKNIDIMQYTGLKDKNGKEIYEGDIVKVPHFLHDERIKINGVVKYVNNRAEFVIDLEDIEETFYCCNQKDRIEVVGNIYENPELLEEEK
ncbi:YopX family protein, partial [Fusobacterium necrophorum]